MNKTSSSVMYDYIETNHETSNHEDRDLNAIRAIQQSLNWALSLPSDKDFKELCVIVENTQSCEGIIKQIRQGYNNPDSLAKIKSAIESMMEECSSQTKKVS